MEQKLFLLFLFSAALAVIDGETLGGPTHGKVVVCYVSTWATYRKDAGKFDLTDIQPSLCTHLVYSFAGLDEGTNKIKSLDVWQDLETDYGKAGYKNAVALKKKYPHLKVTIAVGGWNDGSTKYSKMVANFESRLNFVQSVIAFLDEYKFDGIDFVWKYPGQRGGKPEDKANFVALMKMLKDAFEPLGFILSASLGVDRNTLESSYDLPNLNRYLDFIHMMCYDYHGTWQQTVGANAPLRGIDSTDVQSLEFTIKYMLSQGVSPHKMVLGLPLYGRSFILTRPELTEIVFGSSPTKRTGFYGPFTKEAGFLGYNEICLELTNKSSKWSRHWHDQTATPYIRDGDKIISYDNSRSIAIKIKMAIEYDLGGLMAWSIDTDDFRGSCDTDKDTYSDFVERYNNFVNKPLLREALNSLNLPDVHQTETRNRSTAYTVSDNKLSLRVPTQEYSNYPLMRTINDAITLALQEKRILDEMDRVKRQHEIDNKLGAGVVNTFLGCVINALFV